MADQSRMSAGTHVFVCGYSRSGTTMFYNMLRTTVANFRFFEREMPAHLVIGDTTDSCVTKRPLDILNIDQIVSANRRRKRVICIIVIRDIRAVITSRHESVPNDYFVGFDRQYFIHNEQASFTNPGVLQIHAAIMRASQRKDIGIIVLRYEDLLRDADATQKRLGEAIGFSYRGSFLDFYLHDTPIGLERTLNKRRPVDLAPIDAWREARHRARIRDQFTRCPLLFDILKAYGYEKDDCWFDAYRDEAPAP